MILTFFPDLPIRVICPQLGDSEVAATAPEEELDLFTSLWREACLVMMEKYFCQMGKN